MGNMDMRFGEYRSTSHGVRDPLVNEGEIQEGANHTGNASDDLK